MAHYTGRCHCGAAQFEFSAPEITDAMLCDCSICRRKGGALSTFLVPPDALNITGELETLKTYQFGTSIARHHFCGDCGIHIFVETRLNPGQYRINLGCIDEVDVMELPAQIYDGKSL
ncbi:Putative glutathione-dependent formaldehyde-activating enzyme [Roseovarius albus]|uniref:Putative glutathione-dependent formaldehyde-activating enzyme n=1 Tax=Roseovarius albus TaxID=1247867 RepID=A0A1X6ZP66_9RHOB|nr:GFA family protein [Roseovarius albus]SLN57415.1 Putative glutathione-dependent formaldehyde-activating enzyme [Roseovarius albus]